jgi:hypothetical protein
MFFQELSLMYLKPGELWRCLFKRLSAKLLARQKSFDTKISGYNTKSVFRIKLLFLCHLILITKKEFDIPSSVPGRGLLLIL